MISFRALGILVYIKGTTNFTGGYRTLATLTSDKEHSIRGALRELEKEGYIRRKTYKLGTRYVREMVITESGEQYFANALKINALTLPTKLTSTSLLNSNIYTKYTNGVRENENMQVNGGESMPYDFFDETSIKNEDSLIERQKSAKKKKDEYEEAKSRYHARKITTRQKLSPVNWSSLDIGYEFADRLQAHWHIKPWSLSQSRFVPALGDMRKRLDTDGAIDLQMLDLFFGAIELEKYDSADILWKMFIKQAGQLAPQAKRLLQGAEKFEQAAVESEDSWEGII